MNGLFCSKHGEFFFIFSFFYLFLFPSTVSCSQKKKIKSTWIYHRHRHPSHLLHFFFIVHTQTTTNNVNATNEPSNKQRDFFFKQKKKEKKKGKLNLKLAHYQRSNIFLLCPSLLHNKTYNRQRATKEKKTHGANGYIYIPLYQVQYIYRIFFLKPIFEGVSMDSESIICNEYRNL